MRLTGTIVNNLLDAAKIDNIYNLYNDLLPNSIEIAIYNGNLVKKNTTTAVWYDVVTNNVIKSENTYFSDYALSTYTRDTQNAYHKIPSRFTGAITKNTNYNSSSYLYKKDGKYYVIDPSNPDGSFLATGYFLLLNYPQVRFYDVASSVKVAVSGNDGNLGCYNNSTTSAVMSGGWCDGAGHMDRVGNDFISYLVNNLMTNWIGGGFYQ